MSLANLIRYGKDGPAGSFDDMWLPVFGGEVLMAYAERNLFLDKVDYKSITSGNSAKFPATWKIGSEYHEAGAELLGLDVETREYTITLDDRPLVSHFTVDDIDEMMSHFETRSKFAAQTGNELSRQTDRRIAQLLIKASREAQSNSFPGGGIDNNGTAHVDAALANNDQAAALALLQALDAIAVNWDENDFLPEKDVIAHCAVRPGLWHQVRKLGYPQSAADVSAGTVPYFGHADFDPGNPKIAQAPLYARPLIYNGFAIWRSNHLPTTNVTEGPVKYQGDFTNTEGIVWQPDAIGVLQMGGIDQETARLTTRKCDFYVASMLMGGGALRPYLAVELASA